MELPSNFTLEELLAYGDLPPQIERIIRNAIDTQRDFYEAYRELSTELEAERFSVNDLSSDLADLEEENRELRNEIDSLKSDIDRLKAEIAANKDRFDPDWIDPEED